MVKVTFYYRVGGQTIMVKAKAKNVTDRGVKGLRLDITDEDGKAYDHVMDRETFTEVEQQAIEELQLSL